METPPLHARPIRLRSARQAMHSSLVGEFLSLRGLGSIASEPSSPPDKRRTREKMNRGNQRVIKKKRARVPWHRQSAANQSVDERDQELQIPEDWPSQRLWANRFLAFAIELAGGETQGVAENIWIALRCYDLPNIEVSSRSLMAFDAARQIARETGLWLPPEYEAPWERKKAAC